MSSNYYEDEQFRSGWTEPRYPGRGIGRTFARRVTPVVKALLIVNVAMFLLQAVSPRLFGFYLERIFGLVPERVVTGFWIWQFVTYMFLHSVANLFHILFNMLILFFFGPELEARLGPRRFLVLYFGGGILAGFLFFCFRFLDMPFITLIGASGAIMGLVVLYACYWPNRIVLFMFFFPMKIKHLAMLLVGIDLFNALFVEQGSIAHTAHLGGALFGYLYFRYEGSFLRWIERMEIRAEQQDYKKAVENRGKVDELLEKIHRSGLDSLSGKERKFLKQMSRKYRDQF